MSSRIEPGEIGDGTPGEETRPLITAHELSDRYVFTEADNTEGWIAIDLTVSVESET